MTGTEEVGPHGETLKQEVFSKVERVFHNGLKASDPQLRKDFFALYDKFIGRDLFARLQYIYQDAEWDSLGTWFWITQALDVILSLIVGDAPIKVRIGALGDVVSLYLEYFDQVLFEVLVWMVAGHTFWALAPL